MLKSNVICLFCVVIMQFTFIQAVHCQLLTPQERLISPQLHSNYFQRGSVRIMISDSVAFEEWMKKYLPDVKFEQEKQHKNIYRIPVLTDRQLALLKQSPHLRFAERADRKATPERELGELDLTLNAITSVHDLFPSLVGESLVVSVKENPFEVTDIDYQGRVYSPQDIPATVDVHATAMATIIAGAGNSSPDGKGVASGAILAFSDFRNLLPDNTADLQAKKVSVQNHSYGVAIENYYGIESHEYDKQVNDYPELVHVFSSGNSGETASDEGAYAGVAGFANLTGQFKMSKNTLSVGGADPTGTLEALSSRGPAYDGRVKPEIVAYGDGGTSEAAAVVSGISLLLQQAFLDDKGSLPSSALVRATLINSADDAGRPKVDFEYGYGIADALGAVKTITDDRYFTADVGAGEEENFVINVPSNTSELKVTLAWNDREADPGVSKALINDLDLQLIEQSSSNVYAPWVLNSYPHIDSLKRNARRSSDHLNNVEQVTLANPQQGAYTINVKGFSIPQGAQDFVITYEFVKDFEWVYPKNSDAILAGDNIFIRWHWSGPDAVATASWRIAGQGDWLTIGELNLSQQYLQWVAPDVNDVVQLRLQYDAITVETDEFTVSYGPDMKVGFNCDKDALLYWNGNEVLQFQTYRLGEKYLEAIEISNDTLLAIDKTNESSLHFAVAPIINGRPGVRSRTINLTDAVGCYVQSFLPRELVTDSVLLDLILGTNVGLESLTLQRKTGQGYEDMMTIQSIENTSYVWYDPKPVPGSNFYRIKVVRSNEQIIYSQDEEVIYTRSQDITFFPNPVKPNEPLYVIVNSEVTRFDVYDLLGRLVHQAMDDGEIKTIDPINIPEGVYVIKAITQEGKTLSRRVVVR